MRVSTAVRRDEKTALLALRDKLAKAVDDCDNPRDLPPLTRRLTEVLTAIKGLEAEAGEVPGANVPDALIEDEAF